MKRALTPGTFDPITSGHLDVITRGAQLVDEVIVAAAALPRKNSPCSRLRNASRGRGGDGASSQRARRAVQRASRRLRAGDERDRRHQGLRAVTDFEYEFQMTALNYELDRELETVFIMSPPSVHVSRRLSCAKSQAFMATWGSSSPIA